MSARPCYANYFATYSKSLSATLMLGIWLMLTLTVGPAEAAVYACPTGNGGTAYQDRPCTQLKPAASNSDNDKTQSGKKRAELKVGEYPFGMHASWFKAPAHAPQPAYCDRLGCDCSGLTRNFRSGLVVAVTDALFLETAWHHYSEQVIRMENDPPLGFAKFQLQLSIEDSACEIQMSQVTVMNYVMDAMDKIEENAAAAERRGNTDYNQCDGSDLKVCEDDVEAYRLYERVKLDLETLRLPRLFFIADAD